MDKEQKAAIFEKAIEIVKPVMRFIDKRIIIYDKSCFNEEKDKYDVKIKTYKEKGLLLGDINEDTNEGNLLWERSGYRIVLLRSGKILIFKKKGYYSQDILKKQLLIYEKPKFLSPGDLYNFYLKMYPDKEDSFPLLLITILILRIDIAISKNVNKLAILKSRRNELEKLKLFFKPE